MKQCNITLDIGITKENKISKHFILSYPQYGKNLIVRYYNNGYIDEIYNYGIDDYQKHLFYKLMNIAPFLLNYSGSSKETIMYYFLTFDGKLLF